MAGLTKLGNGDRVDLDRARALEKLMEERSRDGRPVSRLEAAVLLEERAKCFDNHRPKRSQ